jgi:hypothetical protein
MIVEATYLQLQVSPQRSEKPVWYFQTRESGGFSPFLPARRITSLDFESFFAIQPDHRRIIRRWFSSADQLKNGSFSP